MDQRTLDNIVRWRPDARVGHVESFFLRANAPGERLAVWIKFTLLAPAAARRPPVAEVWAVVFDGRPGGAHIAAKESFPAALADLGRSQFLFAVGGSRVEAGATSGRVRAHGREIAWDLRFTEGAPPLHLFPSDALYETELFPKSKSLTPYPASLFSGRLSVDGREIAVRDWPGAQGHNWGRSHARRYAWALSSAFEGHPGTYFEGLSAQVKLGPIETPFLTLAYLFHDGRAYDFRGVRHWWNRSVVVDPPGAWRFRAESAEARLDGTVEAAPGDMVGLVYEDPSGETAHCLNSKLARCRLELAVRAGRGFEPIASLVSDGKAALEILSRDGPHGVEVLA
jgi:hypothetical protein